MSVHDGFPLPDLGDRLTSGFWFAAERHELAIPQCRRCRRWVWYPEAACPWCSQPGPEWTAAGDVVHLDRGSSRPPARVRRDGSLHQCHRHARRGSVAAGRHPRGRCRGR
ncbi:MAG: hypothetical protein HZB15_09560 [Actinobacteria bacterium]|nr:hypothetical protein [Actinomycetota bacterium]